MDDSVSIQLDPHIQILQCVDHPCIIRNVDKAIATFGGQNELDEALARTGRVSSMRPLRVYLSPGNPLSKPLVATRETGSGLLLNVRMYRRKAANGESTGKDQDQVRYEMRVTGLIDTVFRFKTPCDIQCLPIERVWRSEEEAEQACAYRSNIQSLLPSKWVSSDWMASPAEFAPVIMPPWLLRFDPFALRFRSVVPSTRQKDDREAEETADVEDMVDADSLNLVPDRTRSSCWWERRRPAYKMCLFNSAMVPTEPNKRALDMARMHFTDEESLQRAIDAANEELAQRPIWRRDAIERRLWNVLGLARKVHISVLLPVITYLFIDGPFRILLVRLGYDPRTDPTSKRLQGFFLSLRAIRRRASFATASRTPTQRAAADEQQDNEPHECEEFVLEPERVPSQNGTYQFCDVHFEEVQALVHRNDGVETTCSLEHGWVLPDTVPKVRKVLRDHFVRMQRGSTSTTRHRLPRANRARSSAADFDEDEVAIAYGLNAKFSAMYRGDYSQFSADAGAHQVWSNDEPATKPKQREMPARRSKTVARSMLSRISKNERGSENEGEVDEEQDLAGSSLDEDEPIDAEALAPDDDEDFDD